MSHSGAVCYNEYLYAMQLKLNHTFLLVFPGFEPEQNETTYLKRRLREEKAKAAKAEKARREAEERCLVAERERVSYSIVLLWIQSNLVSYILFVILTFCSSYCCLQAVYRLLARRWQNRLNALLSQQEQQVDNGQQQDDVAEELSDLVDLEGGAQNDNNMVVRFENRSSISGLRAILQQLNGDDNEGGENNSDEEAASGVADEEEEHEAVDDIDDMEEDDTEENHHSGQNEDRLEFLEDESVDEFVSFEEEESVVMEDMNVDNNATVVKGERGADQPRTISMSSDDL